MDGLLLIDDEEGVRRSIKRALKRESYRTFVVDNGQAGIDFVRANISRIDTVISDYKMPGLDGLETLAAIGSLNPEITRIILTGYATMEAAIRATNEGLDGFLTKPFDNLELRAKIHEISVRKHLRVFVSEQVYQEIENAPGALQPTYQEASILFADIRGFTRMSQNVTPERLAAFLNYHYFAPMGEIAYRHNGTVDKHIGDSIMVVYGAPMVHADDALMAVRSAQAMQVRAREINARLTDRGQLQLKLGIGVATGRVFSGLLGSLRKKEFTSIGMAVNMAARLQSLAGEGEIIVAQSTKDRLNGAIETQRLPPVTVKGLKEPITVYRILA